MSRSSNTLVALSLALVTVFASGCGSSRKAAYSPRALGTPSAERVATADAAEVEVLLDSEPSRPFAVVGDLQVRTISNTNSILAMQERAAKEGLDGIYWIDCTSTCSGVCTAKGFVYLDGAGPEWKPGANRVIASR